MPAPGSAARASVLPVSWLWISWPPAARRDRGSSSPRPAGRCRAGRPAGQRVVQRLRVHVRAIAHARRRVRRPARRAECAGRRSLQIHDRLGLPEAEHRSRRCLGGGRHYSDAARRRTATGGVLAASVPLPSFARAVVSPGHDAGSGGDRGPAAIPLATAATEAGPSPGRWRPSPPARAEEQDLR